MSDLMGNPPSIQSHEQGQSNQAMLQRTENLGDDLLKLDKIDLHNHSGAHAGNADVHCKGDMHEGIFPRTPVDGINSTWIKSDAQLQNQNEGKSFVDNTAEHDHIPPYLPDPKVTETDDQKINSVGGLFESKDIECKGGTENFQLKTESTDEKRKDDSDSSSGKSTPTVVIDDMVQQSDALSSKEISTCSVTQPKNHASGETTCICSTPSIQHSTFTIKHTSYQNENPGTSSPATENSSTSGIRLQELHSSETNLEILPGSKETSPNVFFPKGKIYEQNFQVGEAFEDIMELGTNFHQTPTPAERHQWVVMNQKYIQKEGYRLGIRPGTFYSSSEGYFVEVPNGVNYEIILTNENPVPCNVDVFTDNSSIPVICFRLNPGKPKKFDGPTFCENKFVFLRSKDAPSHSGIKPRDTKNGLIQAIFTPQKVETLRTRTASEPIPFTRSFSNALEMLGIEEKTRKFRSFTSSAGAERGIDMSLFCEGGTALRGEQTPKVFKKADSMEVDETRQVLMRLRLIARIDDPSLPNDEDICSMYPPSVEELLEN